MFLFTHTYVVVDGGDADDNVDDDDDYDDMNISNLRLLCQVHPYPKSRA